MARRVESLVVLWWLLAASVVFADPKAHHVSFSVFSPERLSGIAYRPGRGKSPVTLSFRSTARSPRYDLEESDGLKLLDELTGAIIAEVCLPAGARRLLLILTPELGEEPTRRFRISVIDESDWDQRPENLRIINFSGLELEGRVNQSVLRLPTGADVRLRTRASLRVELYTNFRGRRFQAYVDTVEVESRRRALLLLWPPYVAGTLQVQSRVLIDDDQSSGARGKK